VIEPNKAALTDPTVHKSGIHFHFKYHLYHIGLLTEDGINTKSGVLTNPRKLQQPVQSSIDTNFVSG